MNYYKDFSDFDNPPRGAAESFLRRNEERFFHEEDRFGIPTSGSGRKKISQQRVHSIKNFVGGFNLAHLRQLLGAAVSIEYRHDIRIGPKARTRSRDIIAHDHIEVLPLQFHQ
jgi:hypothetical protein